ncbi:cell division cycle [Striga asiatica]|uniref:Cell division cycle n=1 Tax=Striga asiatica TaxID=4170 RepID=A0A5A7QI00_STRAF|nr:cell division cycle [Striga asiatica]
MAAREELWHRVMKGRGHGFSGTTDGATEGGAFRLIQISLCAVGMEAILVDSVRNSLQHLMYRNAIFMCERLCAEFPSEHGRGGSCSLTLCLNEKDALAYAFFMNQKMKNLHLLASCYLQNNQAHCAYHILKGKEMAQCRYMFALSCFQMDLMSEAEAALSPNESSAEVPNGAAGHYLLGLVYRYTDRRQSAINHFNQALSLDPLLWVAYEELCILGVADEATSVFDEGASLCIQKQYLNSGSASPSSQAPNEEHIASNRISSSEDISSRKLKHLHNNKLRDISGNNQGTTTNQPLNGVLASFPYYNTPSPMAAHSQLSGVAPPPICRNVQPNGPIAKKIHGSDNSPQVTVNSVAGPRRKFVDEGKLRKVSERLFSDSSQRRSMRLAAESVSTNSSTSVASGNGVRHSTKFLGGLKSSSMVSRSLTIRKGQSWASENADDGTRHDVYDDSRLHITTSSSSPTRDNRSLEPEGENRPSSCAAVLSSSRIIDGASDILGLFRLLGEGLRLSSLCRCQDALNVYMKLPQKHYNTGWVLSQVGKAYFEMVDYLEADRAFSLARIASPHSLEGMDIYSTVLYHLKEDMKLSYLAQELISTDRLAPQSWCAMGNCYSLQKDHETALKTFQRSVQLNSRFAYAHTLCGHEYVALEDFENGVKSYQNALRIDSRHYNAWYGLGMIYLRQEKYEFSEHHFRMAFQINPFSSVIMSYLGTALHALKRNNEALEMMERAVLADKKNPLPLYQKANILVSMDNLDWALTVLEELKEYAPCESSVYALMGSIYKRRNMYDKAMLHFGIALDLKPSATDVAAIKAAIEKLHVPDELDDDSESVD